MATAALELEESGLSYQRVPPGYRFPYGHTHTRQEEVYVVVRARGRQPSPLKQGYEEPLWATHVGHAREGFVLTDAADQAVAVRSQPVHRRLQVVDFEGDIAQPQLVGHGVGRPWLVAGLDEARQFQPGTSVGRPQHDDVTAGVGDADDGVHELALYECSALDLEAQPDEERRHRVEVRNGDANMVETSYVRHEVLRDPLVCKAGLPRPVIW